MSKADLRRAADSLWSYVVRNRAANLCENCEKQSASGAHHIVRRHHNIWRYVAANGVALCTECHQMVHNDVVFEEQFVSHLNPIRVALLRSREVPVASLDANFYLRAIAELSCEISLLETRTIIGDELAGEVLEWLK